jgi:hypothetical protein
VKANKAPAVNPPAPRPPENHYLHLSFH